MAKLNKITRAFNAGELSPDLDSRTDQAKYESGCKTMENFIPLIYGGAQRRPGTEFIASAISSSAKSRLVPFEHSVDDTYVLEFGNQAIRVFKDGARVFTAFGTEDLSSIGSIVAHWLMDDNAANTTVIDDDGATHNGDTVADTDTLTTTDAAGAANEALDLAGVDYVTVSDSNDFSFGDGSNDSAFSIAVWVNFSDTGNEQVIISKYDEANTLREWRVSITNTDRIQFELYDESANASVTGRSLILFGAGGVSEGWHFIVVTYDGRGGADANLGMSIYLDGVSRFVVVSATGAYTAMENLATDVIIGAEATPQILISQAAGTAIGDMTGNGNLAASFDGDNDETAANSSEINNPGIDGPGNIGKDWGAGVTRKITGFKIWGSNDQGFINAANPTVTITLQGSQNNSDWTDLGNASDTDANSLLISKLTGLTVSTAYRYHRLQITHDNGDSKDIYSAEAEFYETNNAWQSGIDNVAVFSKELSEEEVASLTGQSSTIPLSIVSPYLTADLPTLKFDSSADVMFITHPDYEDRRLSRFSDTAWKLQAAALETGPFRDQNTDTTATITPSAVTGTGITLTAAGHSPFVEGTIAGHAPSGSSSTSKSVTGALFKLVHATALSHISGLLDVTGLNSTATLAVPKGVTWDLVTNGTWGQAADTATVVLERSYDGGTTYETVQPFTSAANFNIDTSGTEDDDDATYRLTVTEATAGGDSMAFNLSVRDTSHVGIVKITSVTSPQVAIADVVRTLGATDPTHRWSEGSFSNRRGWPIDVVISSEERLTFAGNKSEPLTTWGSEIGNFINFLGGGTDDADPIQFTLVGTGQQNRIRWMLAKEALVLGTVGGEHLLGASKDEEALTPTNVKAKLQTTYGSEDVTAQLVNQAVLFIQRGGKKVREFLYNFEADAHKADDLTVFANHITGDGIVDWAFQRTPDPILWCVRTDGEMAILNYERDQNVFSWSRVFTNTNLAGTSTKSVIESVAVIFGGVRSEDEVWISVLRQIGGADSRMIERFAVRDLPDAADWKFLDSFITDTGGDTTITGLDHLEGQTVQVLGDGLVQATKVVSSGQITAATTATKYQVGIGYDSTLIPMDIDLEGTGLATTKRINRTIVNVIDTVGGEVGPDTSRLETISSATTAFTGHKEVSIPGGYSRDTDITVRQTDPVPMTVLSLTHDIGGARD